MGWFQCVCALLHSNCSRSRLWANCFFQLFHSLPSLPPSPLLPSLPPLSFPLSLIYTLIQSFGYCSGNMANITKTSCMWSLLSYNMYSTPSLSTVYLSHTFPFLSFSLYIITPKSLHSIILYTHTHAHILSLSTSLISIQTCFTVHTHVNPRQLHQM